MLDGVWVGEVSFFFFSGLASGVWRPAHLVDSFTFSFIGSTTSLNCLSTSSPEKVPEWDGGHLHFPQHNTKRHAMSFSRRGS